LVKPKPAVGGNFEEKIINQRRRRKRTEKKGDFWQELADETERKKAFAR
jgi:hypothetical protein